MVKAGVYLLARLSPILGGSDAWHYLVVGAGAATMLLGALVALWQRDLKRILAYSTVSTLGALVLLLGLDTVLSVKAAMLFLLAHALYKGALFLVAGTVDHETGTRDVTRLGGLARAMPLTAVAAGLAALSMAGLPPMLGFINKELLYEAKLQAPRAAALVTGAGVLANVFLVAVAGIVGLAPFFRRRADLPKKPHEAPPAMLLGPLLLAGIGLSCGLFPEVIANSLLSAAVSAVRAEATTVELKLWHGINTVFALSVLTLAAGAGVYAARGVIRRAGPLADAVGRWGPQRWYTLLLAGLNGLARAQTRLLQNGYLRVYLMVIIVTTVGMAGSALLLRGGLSGPIGDLSDVRPYEGIIAVLILAAALMAVLTPSRLAAAAALSVIGYGVAIIYMLFSAPDLAMTQFAVETLTVILFVLVVYRLPRFAPFSGRRARVRDALLALLAGALMTALVLTATAVPRQSHLASYFAENSWTRAQGRNVVNVILVDFRALDTLGEITVLSVAAIGVYALLRLRLEGPAEVERRPPEGTCRLGEDV
jgi:multicomponent Na+:H+ antiporter subunit A